MSQVIEEAVMAYVNAQFEYKQFLAGVLVFFNEHPLLNKKPYPIIHSIKSRLKDPSHLADKLIRKAAEGNIINKDNIFTEITDFIGVRVLHLYQDQFPEINKAIHEKVASGDWVFAENPKAYTWDPESVQFYRDQNLETEQRETYYTSIHYLVKPNNQNAKVCCEIQVRTLFEEIWGEIDHTINYPKATDSLTCKEQLRVLAKLVSTGTRLADSIFRSHNEHQFNQLNRNHSDIIIHSARYGLKDMATMDVTKKVEQLVLADERKFKVTNDLVDGYDLYHGDRKLLNVDFTINGQRKQISVMEQDIITLE